MENEGQIKIGTSGYSYPGPPPKGWVGVFYPKSKRLDQLAYYSQFFDTVEINSSFYAAPAPRMVDAWVGKTPSRFEFSIKLWQKFTHARKVVNQPDVGAKEEWEPITQKDVDVFRSSIDALARSGKLGALLIQYPPGFHRTSQNMDKLVDTLRYFRSYPKAVELRHRSWSDEGEETKDLLREYGASLVLIDEPKFSLSIRQPFESEGQILYFRAHGRNSAKWWDHKEPWERYDYCYSWEHVRSIARILKKAIGSTPELRKALIYGSSPNRVGNF